jgi:transcriptional regulator with XRE-family HTH domain
LGKRSISVISEYEKGTKMPPLETALRMEIIYNTPLAELFPSLHAALSSQITRELPGHAVALNSESRAVSLVSDDSPREQARAMAQPVTYA